MSVSVASLSKISWSSFTDFPLISALFGHRAFDTLAKALNTTDSASPPSLADGIDASGGGSIHVISRDQSTPIIEVEGPLLSDTHVTFKVSTH